VQNTIWPDPEDLWSEGANSKPSCLFVRPQNVEGPLPTLYLLHGKGDQEDDWWANKGQLGGILAETRATPMLIVMPFCAKTKRHIREEQEVLAPSLFRERFAQIDSQVQTRFGSNTDERRAILGISMGGQQALSIVLNNIQYFSALGVLSGMLQDPYDKELIRSVQKWPQNLGQELKLYFHYCGKLEVVFYNSNKEVCKELGGKLKDRDDGKHNWVYWRREISEFIRQLSEKWSQVKVG
jgi:S-formylglutathione hydrolase FrmB